MVTVFLATFTYALTVLRTVRSADEGTEAFVPQVSVTLALLLALGSVITLVLFLAHLARKIRVETLLRDVHREASALAPQLLDEQHETSTPDPALVPSAGAVPLLAGSSGFLVRVDEQQLLAAAVVTNMTVEITRLPGDSLVAGTPIGRAWACEPGSPAGGRNLGTRGARGSRDRLRTHLGARHRLWTAPTN